MQSRVNAILSSEVSAISPVVSKRLMLASDTPDFWAKLLRERLSAKRLARVRWAMANAASAGDIKDNMRAFKRRIGC